METTTIKYKVIKNADQYKEYCIQLENLLSDPDREQVQDEIDLLTLLIEKYDENGNTFHENDPISLLHSFLKDHNLKAQDLTTILGISKGYVSSGYNLFLIGQMESRMDYNHPSMCRFGSCSISDILNYKKGLSKEVIRKLAIYFKVRQEAFNRPYKLL